MAQDKEKIKELNKKIKDLEGIVEQKNFQLHDYQDIEKIADEKIKGLNAIHAEKIRALMNSIQLLKKEKASMGKQTKEHKRSELIQQLNKEIGDQDTIIDTLRGLIGDPKKADAAIIQTLSKGPARIRVETREELKMQIKELKAKLLKYEKKKGQGTAVEEDKMDRTEEQASVISARVIEAKNNAGNAEYIMKINDLNNELEDVQLVVSGKQTEIDKYKQLISKKNQEIIELTQAKIDLKFMVTKNEELKKEVDALQQKLHSDLYTNYDQEIKLGELELAQAVHKNIQNKNSEAVKLEIETLQTKMGEMLAQNKQMVVNHTKLKDENVNLRKLLEDAKERNRKLHSEHEEQVNKLHATVKEKEATIKAVNTKLADYESQFDQLQVEIKNKEDLVGELEAKVAELEETIANLPERVSSRKGSEDVEAHNKELEEQRYELEKEINHLKQESYRLRERVKELTKSEIELSDRVDILEQENRFLHRKVIAANLITKENFNDHVAPEEVQKNLREVSQRYEVRIKELVKRIYDLEERNKDLEEIQNIMNNPSSTKSLDGQIGSMALTEGNESLMDKL